MQLPSRRGRADQGDQGGGSQEALQRGRLGHGQGGKTIFVMTVVHSRRVGEVMLSVVHSGKVEEVMSDKLFCLLLEGMKARGLGFPPYENIFENHLLN